MLKTDNNVMYLMYGKYYYQVAIPASQPYTTYISAYKINVGFQFLCVKISSNVTVTDNQKLVLFDNFLKMRIF
jgi:hypothetical protein